MLNIININCWHVSVYVWCTQLWWQSWPADWQLAWSASTRSLRWSYRPLRTGHLSQALGLHCGWSAVPASTALSTFHFSWHFRETGAAKQSLTSLQPMASSRFSIDRYPSFTRHPSCRWQLCMLAAVKMLRCYAHEMKCISYCAALRRTNKSCLSVR